MTEYEKMLNGQVFDGRDPEIGTTRARAFDLLHQIRQSPTFAQTQSLFRELFAAMGEESLVNPPFNCEFGKQIHIGRKTFLNIGVIMLDGARIDIGDNVMIGPNVQFYTASHDLNHLNRRQWEAYCKPIKVENDVWIGGSAVINQGVTIGARSVIAANSVVNHNVPADCVVGGIPAKVIKRLD